MIDGRIGLTLGQHGIDQSTGSPKPGEAWRIAQQRPGSHAHEFGAEVAEMLGQARPPTAGEPVAWLEGTALAPPRPTQHQAGMTTVMLGQNMQH